jgi:hypothetical protein
MSDQQTRATGTCLCKGVRFDVRGPIRDVIVCHCGQCRRTHGHVAAYTSAARADVVFHEDSTLRWYVSSELARRGFCSACGASLFWEPTGEDPPTGLKTARHVYVHDASDYYEITDDLPRDDDSHYRG